MSNRVHFHLYFANALCNSGKRFYSFLNLQKKIKNKRCLSSLKRLRVRSYISKFTLLMESMLIFLQNFKKYLFIWLCQALVVACVTFDFL